MSSSGTQVEGGEVGGSIQVLCRCKSPQNLQLPRGLHTQSVLLSTAGTVYMTVHAYMAANHRRVSGALNSSHGCTGHPHALNVMYLWMGNDEWKCEEMYFSLYSGQCAIQEWCSIRIDKLDERCALAVSLRRTHTHTHTRRAEVMKCS